MYRLLQDFYINLYHRTLILHKHLYILLLTFCYVKHIDANLNTYISDPKVVKKKIDMKQIVVKRSK